MKIPVKTLKSGFSLPVYGMGLWQVGGRWEADKSKDAVEIQAIQSAIEKGITHFDVAEGYAAGHSEELLGTAISGYKRQELFITSKVSGSNQGYDGVLRAFEKSLKRMKLDYLDLYLLHRYPDPGLDIKETMKAMTQLVDRGVVKNIGVSNMTISRFEEAQKHTPHKLVCNQLHYNIEYREVEKYGLVDYCQNNDIFLVAWRPLQKGELQKARIVEILAKKYGKTPNQIAINWLISQPNVVTISKTSSAQHLNENLGAIGWNLDPADIELISKKFPNQKFISDTVPLSYMTDLAA